MVWGACLSFFFLIYLSLSLPLSLSLSLSLSLFRTPFINQMTHNTSPFETSSSLSTDVMLSLTLMPNLVLLHGSVLSLLLLTLFADLSLLSLMVMTVKRTAPNLKVSVEAGYLS